MYRGVWIVILSTLLVGCSGDVSVAVATGGRLLDYERGDIIHERKLTEDEAKGASEWLNRNGKDWGRDFATYAPDVLAYLEHSDGTSSGLYVFQTSVVFVSRGTQFRKAFQESQTRELTTILGLGREG